MIRKIIFAVLLLLMAAPAAIAQQDNQQQDNSPTLPVQPSEKYSLIDSITARYYEWETISMSGKLSSPMLPVTASLKVYMEKDSLILITVSAPLIGEAARIEIDQKEALVVNKLKNSYATVDMAMIEPICPGGLAALQNLFLGRITLLGYGTLSPEDGSQLEIYSVGGGANADGSISEPAWTLLPEQDLENSPFVYFYTLDKETLQLERFAVLSQDGGSQIDCFYTWGSRNVVLDFISVTGGRTMEATLQLNNPDSTTKPISRFQLSSRYKKTDLKGILK